MQGIGMNHFSHSVAKINALCSFTTSELKLWSKMSVTWMQVGWVLGGVSNKQQASLFFLHQYIFRGNIHHKPNKLVIFWDSKKEDKTGG